MTRSADDPSLSLETGRIRAVVLDADGVLTHSEQLRVTAWHDTLDAFLAQYARVTGRPRRPLDAYADLPAQLTGRLDQDTADEMLRSHGCGLDLAAEHLGPSPVDLLRLLTRHEDQRFLELLQSRGVRARKGAHRLLLDLRAAGVPTAAVSTGRHCTLILTRAGLADCVDASVDAEDAERHRLAGPPEPALYQFALKLLHKAPAQAALVVDTAAGLEAGRRGGFGLVVGVDHQEGERARLLPDHGPVVPGLDGLAVVPAPTAGRR